MICELICVIITEAQIKVVHCKHMSVILRSITMHLCLNTHFSFGFIKTVSLSVVVNIELGRPYVNTARGL